MFALNGFQEQEKAGSTETGTKIRVASFTNQLVWSQSPNQENEIKVTQRLGPS